MDDNDIVNLVRVVVENAARSGEMLFPGHEANQILETYPNCRVPFDVLRYEIIKLATAQGVPVDDI